MEVFMRESGFRIGLMGRECIDLWMELFMKANLCMGPNREKVGILLLKDHFTREISLMANFMVREH